MYFTTGEGYWKKLNQNQNNRIVISMDVRAHTTWTYIALFLLMQREVSSFYLSTSDRTLKG